MISKNLYDNKTGIILVVTNEKHNLHMLYESLSKQTYKNFELYFIDNNSSDGSVDYSKEINNKFGFVIKYVLLKENSGDAKGNSIGAKEALKNGCSHIFILNNDTELEPNCLLELLKLIESDEKIGVAGPIFFYWTEEKSSNKIQIYGAHVNFKTQKTEIVAAGKIYEDLVLPDVLECDYPIGGAMLIKKEVIEKLGDVFDERYFMYNNEIDFAYRLKRLGYRSFATLRAKIWHNHKWVRDNKSGWYREYYLSARNKFLYFHKYKLYLPMIIEILSDLAKFPVRIRWFIKVCDSKLSLFYLRGLIDGIFGRKGKPRISF